MKIADLLLIAPLGFCLGGAAAGIFLDIGFSQLCVGISAASIAALGLYWLIGRAHRRPPASGRLASWPPRRQRPT